MPVFQVRFHDVFDVLQIHIAVPGTFGVNHRHWPGGAAVQASGLVHPHFARASQALGFDQLFAMVKRFLGVMLGAALLAVFAFIQAKEDVALVVGCYGSVLGGGFKGGSQGNPDVEIMGSAESN